MSALWGDATCCVEESGDVSPHSKGLLLQFPHQPFCAADPDAVEPAHIRICARKRKVGFMRQCG
jgi:hypothetical protein